MWLTEEYVCGDQGNWNLGRKLSFAGCNVIYFKEQHLKQIFPENKSLSAEVPQLLRTAIFQF